MNSFKNDVLEAAAIQLSLDYSCTKEDFLSDRTKIVNAKINRGRRNIVMEKKFFSLASMGNGVVASISPEIYTFTKVLMEQFNYNPIEIFDAKGIYFINDELKKYDKVLGGFHQYYLPKTPYNYNECSGYNIVTFKEDGIKDLYSDNRFTNALLYNTKELRRDVLAVCMYNGRSLMGVAGASNDSDKFWQIGIDIIPEYRGKGVGTALVSKLTKEIFMSGAIPYYGTWWSNIASRKLACRCGYYPAWVEMEAVDIPNK